MEPFRGLINSPGLAGESLFRGGHLSILLDIAPITPYHILIASHRHVPAMAYLSGEEVEELADLKSRVRQFHRTVSGLATLFFEHGAGGEGEGAACIDHAHLHAVPISVADFLPAVEHLVRRLGPPLDESARAGTAYLALEFEPGAQTIWHDQGVPCQYFRQLIAAAVGNSDRWKWQSCLALDEIERTQNWLTDCVEKWARK